MQLRLADADLYIASYRRQSLLRLHLRNRLLYRLAMPSDGLHCFANDVWRFKSDETVSRPDVLQQYVPSRQSQRGQKLAQTLPFFYPDGLRAFYAELAEIGPCH